MNAVEKPLLYFVVPGDIRQLTGGYAYDRQVLEELHKCGCNTQLVQLSDSFPFPDHHALADAEQKLSALPEGAVVIIDGLAFGVMDKVAEEHAQRLKIIALCHHPLALESGLSPSQVFALKSSEMRALSFAHAVVVTSRYTANLLKQDFAVPDKKIIVASPGTFRQRFAACQGDPPVLLTLATLTQRKGHNYLIEALAHLKHLPWQARFVGSDQLDPEWAKNLRAKVASYGLQARIHFVGAVADVTHEYMQADVFVLPSLFEGYGMAFAEALSFGVPIVATRAGAVPDVVPAQAGILVPPANAEALGIGLARIISDSNERRRLQQEAQRAALQLGSWADTAEIINKLIQQVSK